MDNDSDELSFYGNNPGAARYGNFINYYSFHSATERLKHLQQSMFPSFNSSDTVLVLDIGCNTGELTIEVAKYLEITFPQSKVYVLAIDIDPVLIERASTNNLDNISFIACNIVTEHGQQIIKDYLNKFNRNTFDITLCFSVTMWIHINNGDHVFLDFLKFIKLISKCIIVEPQPWKCYKNAQRRLKRAGKQFEKFDLINIRDNVDEVIEQILSESTHKKIFESQSSSWNRKIQSYHILDGVV